MTYNDEDAAVHYLITSQVGYFNLTITPRSTLGNTSKERGHQDNIERRLALS